MIKPDPDHRQRISDEDAELERNFKEARRKFTEAYRESQCRQYHPTEEEKLRYEQGMRQDPRLLKEAEDQRRIAELHERSDRAPKPGKAFKAFVYFLIIAAGTALGGLIGLGVFYIFRP